jgi:hypothetical protein
MEAMNEQHYRDYPSDRAIDHQDQMLSRMEDRFGEPSEADLRAARERLAKQGWVIVRDAAGVERYVRKNEVQQ